MSLAASPNRHSNGASITLKDLIGRYSRELGQDKQPSPLTERKLNNSRSRNEVNSLATTLKDLRGTKENLPGREIGVSESLRSSRQ